MTAIKLLFHKFLLFLYYFFFGVSGAKIEAKKIAANPRFPSFLEFYEKDILPKAEFFEQIRIINLKKFIFRARIHALANIALIALMIYLKEKYYLSHQQQKQMLQIFIAASFLTAYWPFAILLNFKVEIKKVLFGEIFRFLNFFYEPRGSGVISAYKPSLIIPNYDEKISTTEDLVTGIYNNVEFTFEEMHLKEEVRSGKNRRQKTTFKGCIIKLKFNKNFLGTTVLKKDRGKFFNFSYKYDLGTVNNLQKIHLEDVDFERMFEIYSSDQIEARYLLTTSFMERLKRLSDFFKTTKIQASFFENSLLISFEGCINLFEINSIFEEIDIAMEVTEILKEISLIYDLINSLKLNEKITL